MKRNVLKKLISMPLSNKLSRVSGLYWAIKSQLFYRLMFKSFGAGTILFRPLFIQNADCIEIGEDVFIRDGIRLEAVRDPFGRTPLLTIGSSTNIEQGVHIICHNRVKIGRNVSITGRCAIVDVTHPYQNPAVGKIGALIADDDSFVEICDGAFLGYGAVILPNVRIGKRAVVGANSVVTRDVPDYSVVAGVPARIIKVYAHESHQGVAPGLEKERRSLD